MTVIAGPEEWMVVTDALEPGDELVRVQVPGRPGVFVKMEKADAVEKGLYQEPKLEPKQKKRRARNKKRQPEEDK